MPHLSYLLVFIVHSLFLSLSLSLSIYPSLSLSISLPITLSLAPYPSLSLSLSLSLISLPPLARSLSLSLPLPLSVETDRFNHKSCFSTTSRRDTRRRYQTNQLLVTNISNVYRNEKAVLFLCLVFCAGVI